MTPDLANPKRLLLALDRALDHRVQLLRDAFERGTETSTPPGASGRDCRPKLVGSEEANGLRAV